MAKKDVTYLQVKSIADKILLTGERPTVQRVYDLLRVVATRKQISHYIRQWRSENKDIQQIEKKNNHVLKTDVDQFIEARTQELKRSLSLVRATLESTADGILLVDNDGRLVDFNSKFVDIACISKDALERGEEEVGLESVLNLLENPQDIIELVMHLKNHPETQGDMGEVKFIDGRIIERYSQPHRLGSEIVGRVWSFRDVTERRKAEESLRLRQRAITASTHGVIILENNDYKKVIYVNPSFIQITGMSEIEILGKSFNALHDIKKNIEEWNVLESAIREQRDGLAVLSGHKKNGNVYWVEVSISPITDNNNQVTHFVAIMNDITAHRALEHQLMHQATHDALTDLPNRILLEERIRQMIYSSKVGKKQAAILFLDLDRFKIVNDSLGHKMGDEVIKRIGERLRILLRATDTVARVGGDEYIIMLSTFENVAEVELIVNKVLEEIRIPIDIAGHKLNFSTSIGISLYPNDGDDAQALIRNADTAMYHAKDAGRDGYQFYNHQMNKKLSKILMLENSLHKALDGNEFELHYQPVIDLKTQQVVSVEALIRWNHPELGMVSPTDFIFIAEETGLIVPIGEWVLETACAHWLQWMNLGLPNFTVSVNVSARQMKNNKIVNSVERVLQKLNFPPESLVLELTENILMDSAEETVKMLDYIKSLGVSLAIDDFGTGYSSLSYLKRFPIDKVKIDRAFVRDIASDLDNQTIVIAIIAMVKSLGLKVLAEGAETLDEMNFLITQQCDELQGYYFSKPLSYDLCTRLLHENFKISKK